RPGAGIEGAGRPLVGRGEPQAVQFGVGVPRDRDPGCLLGTVTVSNDGGPLGHVTFKLAVVEAGGQRGGEPVPVGDAAHHYRKAFVSYASADRPEVVKRVQMLARLGIDYFQDVLSLEPGERWARQLYRHIEESDLFLLSGPAAAGTAEGVPKERRPARRLRGDDPPALPAIQPVVIEGPPPPPPPLELADLHFNDYLLYFMRPPEG